MRFIIKVAFLLVAILAVTTIKTVRACDQEVTPILDLYGDGAGFCQETTPILD